MNWTQADLDAHLVGRGVQPGIAPPAGPRQPKGYRSKTEAAYAQHLDLMVHAGQLKMWRYEAVRLALAPGVTYIPDFLEVMPDGSVLLVEVKGRKGSGFWTLPVSKVKVRMAAALFPWWKFAITWPGARLGTWDRMEL